jgi:Cof subfamily protein (haloacid dehalogenase superfamily)
VTGPARPGGLPALPQVVTTERLRLPLWTAADVADLRAGRRRPEWHRDFPRPDDVDAASMWVEGDTWGPRSIVRGSTVLGSIGFFGPPVGDPPETPPETEVGYGLVEEARGWGFATEALRGLLAAADRTGPVVVRASVDPGHKASLRVLSKTGFTGLRGSDEQERLVMARPAPGGASGASALAPSAGSPRARRGRGLPRLVATDLDGTLVRSDGSVSARTSEVLLELERRGVPTVFVTGRPLRWAEEVFEHVGTHGLAVVSNGAIVWDVSRSAPALERPVAPADALEACLALRAAVPGTTYAVEHLGGIALETEFVERYRMPDDAVRGTLEEILARPVHKILARHEELGPEEFWRLAEAAVPDLLTITWSSSTTLLEMSAAGVTKATTLALLCDDLGIDAAEVIAFGDMPNDLPMLAWAGTSYAMADAHPSVTAAADHVAPGHDDDGVATVLAGVFAL